MDSLDFNTLWSAVLQIGLVELHFFSTEPTCRIKIQSIGHFAAKRNSPVDEIYQMSMMEIIEYIPRREDNNDGVVDDFSSPNNKKRGLKVISPWVSSSYQHEVLLNDNRYAPAWIQYYFSFLPSFCRFLDDRHRLGTDVFVPVFPPCQSPRSLKHIILINSNHIICTK